MADLMQQARDLVEKLDSAAASWPTVYASDREIISLLLAAATTIESLREAALRAAPEGFVLVPVELALRVEDSLGRFVSDEGWGSDDMGVADDLSGLLAARPQGVEDA